ncbi:hypothetical protein M23134_01623 [Microscilla marina ATCC 23134]|uniref:Uncharacterized protein n=1 Tax=Microscilla marina ATCC 23134 TaxID=313606 RepID=A1ZTP1_MICM2|nr:hypothetical protein M23134_01623 [Microscilla marina ATCC 23134]
MGFCIVLFFYTHAFFTNDYTAKLGVNQQTIKGLTVFNFRYILAPILLCWATGIKSSEILVL